MNTDCTVPDFPIPDEQALAHSQGVSNVIRASIETEGPLSLGDYMQFVLYGPDYGYYMTGNEKIGAAGDFVTAPAISPLFARCLATQASEVLNITGGDILEFGAGAGQLVVTLLSAMEQTGVLPQHYYILEPSAELVARQQQRISTDLPAHLQQLVSWVSTLPVNFVGVVLANEVLDAMPVEQFVVGADATHSAQIYIGLENGKLCRQLGKAAPLIADEVKQLQNSLDAPLPVGYCSEINLLLAPWLKSLGDCVSRGLLLLIDYGYPRKEYYLPQRARGTLRCYFRHHMHEDVLRYPGLQDITADVDFTRAVGAAIQAGFDLHGYTSQAQFLLGNNLAELAQQIAADSDIDRFALAQQVNTLSGAQAMGERFQVMGLSKSLDAELKGFMQADFSHRL